jgi:heat shock protein HslJ
LPTKVHEGVSVSFIEYEVSTAYSVSGNGEELTLYATAVGRDDNSEAPHASLHVGRPIVRLTRIPSIDVFEEDGNGNESDVDSGEDEWDANERNTDNGIDNSVFALEGSNWKLAEIRGFEAIDKNKRPVTSSFDSDTSVRGFDGCNRFFGAMDVLSGIGVLPSFRVGNVSSTRLGCRGDALRKQMNMFYDVLRSNAVTYNIVNGEVVELELYATNVDGNGRQTQGELLARFKWVETEFW